MPLEFKDRVKDQTNTTGTGTFTIDGVAPTGYRSISAAHTTGMTVRYTVINGSGSEWEVGEGVWTSSGSTLTRATVYSSSNGGALVNFSAGAKAVFTGPVAADRNGVIDTNLAFTGATTVGSLVNLSQSWVANTTNGEPPSQLIVADGDLTTFSWSFTGTVVANWTYLPGFTAPQGNLDERLKLDIKLTNATLIPAPGAGLALVMGGLVAARRRRSIR